MKTSLILSFSFEQEEEAFEELKKYGIRPLLIPAEKREGWTEKELVRYWRDLEQKPEGILMGADMTLSGTFFREAPELKYISLNCAGYDHLDLEACQRYGITVCNVPRRNYNAVADLAWGQILCLMRRIASGDKAMRNGRWNEGVTRGFAVCQKTLGIVGLGAIGQGVAKRAAGFDMKLAALSTSENPELAQKYGIKYLEKEVFFRYCDIIVLTCPAAENTWHLVNGQTLGWMKKDAFLINPSRGALIDEQALIKALQEGRIAGAALDVYEEEPLLQSPLFDMENVLLTPHLGGLADREIHEVAMCAAVNMGKMMNGEKADSMITFGEAKQNG